MEYETKRSICVLIQAVALFFSSSVHRWQEQVETCFLGRIGSREEFQHNSPSDLSPWISKQRLHLDLSKSFLTTHHPVYLTASAATAVWSLLCWRVELRSDWVPQSVILWCSIINEQISTIS
jgi:hypothetical protein